MNSKGVLYLDDLNGLQKSSKSKLKMTNEIQNPNAKNYPFVIFLSLAGLFRGNTASIGGIKRNKL